MIIACDKFILQDLCSTASRAVASKSPIPALEGLLLEAGNELCVTGYDLKKGIYGHIPAEVEEPGSIVVGARLFVEMIRRLPEGTVTISADSRNNVNVKCGQSDYHFMGIDTGDYPEIPAVDEQHSVRLQQRVLKSMINQTLFAVSNNDARPVYMGTLFETEGSELTLVSVDGYRLARRSCQLEEESADPRRFIVPGSALADVERICDDSEEEVKISVGAKHIFFIIGETVVVTRRIEGEFLNYRKSIPELFKVTVTVDRDEFLTVIDRVSLIVSDKNSNPVRLRFEDGFIHCSCVTPVGKAEDICPCEGDGNGLEIGFNDRFLKDALKAASTDALHVCLNSSSSPTVIEAADGSRDFTYMILPVRLRAGE